MSEIGYKTCHTYRSQFLSGFKARIASMAQSSQPGDTDITEYSILSLVRTISDMKKTTRRSGAFVNSDIGEMFSRGP